MTDFLKSFIEGNRSLATTRGLPWPPRADERGAIVKEDRWNLTQLAGMVPPPTLWLSTFAPDEAAAEILNDVAREREPKPPTALQISSTWRDLLLAALINEIVVKKNKPAHAYGTVGRAIRILATCAASDPADLNGDDVQMAYNVALRVGASGKLAANIAMVVRTIIDGLHLSERSPLAAFCRPYSDAKSQSAQATVDVLTRKVNRHRQSDSMRKALHERKNASKLPDERAFWELTRIVFAETPQTFSDAVRFAQVKLAILTGLRVGENVMLPADWKRWREYVDSQGKPAGERGGISRSLMMRYFAEKQEEADRPEGIALFETAQHVPAIYEDTMIETLDAALHMTTPLRDRLRRQTETGRILPEYDADALVDAVDLYSHISGNIEVTNTPIPDTLLQAYRLNHDVVALEAIRQQQRVAEGSGLSRSIYKFWRRFVRSSHIQPYSPTGALLTAMSADMRSVFFKIADVEALVRDHMPTKLSDVTPFNGGDGSKIYPHELMFLLPIRGLAENRQDGVIDIEKYAFVGRASVQDMAQQLGLGSNNIFSRYGENDEARGFKLESHSFRHLQNAELFRLGVADTIITKRFRKSVAQSYEYDHRSLSEDLAAIDLPATSLDRLGPRAQEALRLITANKVSGPIVDEFRLIQRTKGDDAAFDYLDAEADGLHVTPYGFCLNSFTVDPCPKHLECFDGCHHLARTELPEEARNLEQLRDRLKRVVEKIERQPIAARNVGWQNQLAHAKKRLTNVESALLASPGSRPFPDGLDLFTAAEHRLGSTILDRGPKDVR
jgi:hypothetical protein